jgi:TolB-like protein/Tfp pilus assembly protein PilF
LPTEYSDGFGQVYCVIAKPLKAFRNADDGRASSMDEPTENVLHGLTWPEAYGPLRPLIGEQWGIGDELYLTRQLSGGRSGAMVYLADVTGKDFTGQAILKLDRAPDPTWQEKSEAERHVLASESAPDFAEKHLPKIVHTAHHGDSLAILSTIAGRGLEFASSWSACDYDRQLSIARRLSRALLEDWNPAAKLAPGLQSPATLLRSWLGYRLDPQEGRVHSFLSESCDVPPEEPSFTFDGRWYPNPLAFVAASPELLAGLRLRAMLGNVHGDLNGLNVLVSATGAAKDHYYLIDLALYENRQFLFYDHAYFALSHLLAMRGGADAPHWRSIMDGLCPYEHIQPNTGLRGDDIGLINLLKLLRQEAFEWVDRNQTHRLSYMESQFQLAQVAVGLNFTHKQLPDHQRRLAFLYGAAILKDYLKLHGVDWPKHGPPFALEGRPQSARQTPTTAPSASPSTGPADVQLALPEKPAIAVLAFENQSGDPEQEYFADGVSDEIIMALSRIDWLMVISRGSSFAYKGQAVDIKRIGKELGVHYVVEGVVRKAGERVRVTAQLADAQVDKQLWTEHFDRHLDDIFELQEDIAAAIVANIDARLRVAEREQAKRKGGNVTLWEGYQKALWHFYKLTEEDAGVAKQQLSDLFGLAPTFAGYHAALTLLEVRRILFGDPDGMEDSLQAAQKHAIKAVELDEGNGLAHVALSRVFMFQGKYDQAIEEAQLSITVNPSSSEGHLNLAVTLLWGERADEALPALEQSMRLSPKGPWLRLKILVKGLLMYFLDNYSEAERLVRQAEASNALAPFAQLVLSAILVRQKRLEEARNIIKEVHALRPKLSISRLRTSWRTMAPRYRDKLLGDLETAGLPV